MFSPLGGKLFPRGGEIFSPPHGFLIKITTLIRKPCCDHLIFTPGGKTFPPLSLGGEIFPPHGFLIKIAILIRKLWVKLLNPAVFLPGGKTYFHPWGGNLFPPAAKPRLNPEHPDTISLLNLCRKSTIS
jgi:hypothetical protein